jgi:hypothetical protein
MGDAPLQDALGVGACASLVAGAWRARFFVGDDGELRALDDATPFDEAPAGCGVCVECVLPSGASVEFTGVPAGDTVADVKARLRSDTCSAPPQRPLDDLDELFLEFKQGTAAPGGGGVAQAVQLFTTALPDVLEDAAAPAEAQLAAAADAPAPADAADDDTQPQCGSRAASPAAAAAPAAQEAPLPALEPAPPSEPSAPLFASAVVAPQRPPAPLSAAASPQQPAACSIAEAPAASARLPALGAQVLDAVSLVCSGAQLVGTWQPAAHLAALCVAVALVVTVSGYTAFCTFASAVMYARVLHEQRSREAAQAEAAQMRAEVRAAHRQIAATVAALARADACMGGGALASRSSLGEESEWLNAALAACWTGWLASWLSTTLASAVSDGLRQKTPPGLDDIALVSLEFDAEPPRLSPPRMLHTHGVAKAGGQLTLSFGLSLLGDVGLRLRLAARLSLLRARIVLPVDFRASEADVTVSLVFLQSPPYVRSVRVSLLAPPRIGISCRPFGAVDVTDIPGVDAWVQGALEGALRRLLVAPAGHTWDIEAWWLEEQRRKAAAEAMACAYAAA